MSVRAACIRTPNLRVSMASTGGEATGRIKHLQSSSLRNMASFNVEVAEFGDRRERDYTPNLCFR